MGYIYILANANNAVLYIGVTSDLVKRVFEHKTKVFGGFAAQYNVDKLVYFEQYESIEEAIKREKRLKKYSRAQKEGLVVKKNPEWRELYDGIIT